MKFSENFFAGSAGIPKLVTIALFILPWSWISAEQFQSLDNSWFYFEFIRAFGLPFLGGVLCFFLVWHVKKFTIPKSIFFILLSYPAFLFFTSLLNSKDVGHLILVMFMILVPVYFGVASNYTALQESSNSDTIFRSIFMVIFDLLSLKVLIFMTKDVTLGLISGIYNGYSAFEVFGQQLLNFYPPRSTGMARSAALLVGFSCYAFLINLGHKRKLTVLVGVAFFALFFLSVQRRICCSSCWIGVYGLFAVQRTTFRVVKFPEEWVSCVFGCLQCLFYLFTVPNRAHRPDFPKFCNC